ncbi:MAG: beta-aspartyl-peptidase [Gammaproteobacteria bacterium]|nr:beta-aspartyl-peptidase [Gammaproteobacteria bacterium]MDH4315907.1 beta-aspartyl-peptidase [Gammaproteobacteria bacterium]MDH5215601.1 beta-aspartyl-peptidase [Gammaproteobacteria bacterium]
MLQLLTNARVFAPADTGIRHLLVGGGRILAVAEKTAGLATASATVVDVGGRRLIPGFIDGHAHVTGGGGESGFASRVPPQPIGRFTSAGVTTVVGVLGTDDTTRDTRSLLAQTRGLREEGLGAWCHTGGYHLPPVTLTGSVRDDIVFLDPVIGVGEVALSDHRSSQPTCDELLRLASDAHVAGMISGKAGIVHLHLGDGSRGLDLVRQALQKSEIPGRVFNPTHVNRRKALFDEALALTRHGCSVDITAFPVGENEDAWAADVALLRYLDSAAPAELVTVSSDGGGCLPVFNDRGEITEMDVGRPAMLTKTLQDLLKAGAKLQAVLPAFTSNVASLLRFHDRGRIATGLAADLVVLGDDNRIDDVMVAGIWHVRDGQQQVYGQFERQQS